MAVHPSNVTGSIVGWEPTCHIRLAGKKPTKAEMQQLWINRMTGESEWREVPFVQTED